MKKVRLALLAALAVSLGIVVILWKVNFTGWVVWVETGVMIVAGFFVVAVAVLFLVTLFRTKGGDLWDSGYFRYMRAFWGEKWGGGGVLYQIDVCRATWLSVVTFLAWVLLVSFAGYLVYFFMAGTISGFETISSIWQEDDSPGANLFLILFFHGIVGSIVLLIFTVVLFSSGSIESELPGLHKATGRILIILIGFFLIMTLIVVPIKYAGVGPYFIFLGYIAGGMAAFSGIVWLIRKAISGLLKFFARETVPGALVNARVKGWICPLIIQKPSKD